MSPPFERRRAEDVFRVVETEVFPRLGAIDSKIDSLERGVNRLTVEGCAQRTSDIHRVEATEHGIVRIFERIDEIVCLVTDSRVAMVEQVGLIKTDMAAQVGDLKVNQEKQYGGLKGWIQAGVIIILLSLGAYLAKDYFHDLEVGAGKHPAVVTAPAK